MEKNKYVKTPDKSGVFYIPKIFLAFSMSSFVAVLTFSKGYCKFKLSHLYFPKLWYGKSSIFSTDFKVERNSFNFIKSSLSSVNPGTITWRIHIGILLSLKYFAKFKLLVFGAPIKLIDFSLLICFISSKTKSVTLNSSFISSVIVKLPAVSKHVWILSSWSFLKRIVTCFAWSNGSPPETVTPPCDETIKDLEWFIFLISSSISIFSPRVCVPSISVMTIFTS